MFVRQKQTYGERWPPVCLPGSYTTLWDSIGKFETVLIVFSFGDPWTPEVVDSYLKNQGRINEMRDLGFKGIAFVHVVGKGKKAKSNLYAAFELNQL